MSREWDIWYVRRRDVTVDVSDNRMKEGITWIEGVRGWFGYDLCENVWGKTTNQFVTWRPSEGKRFDLCWFIRVSLLPPKIYPTIADLVAYEECGIRWLLRGKLVAAWAAELTFSLPGMPLWVGTRIKEMESEADRRAKRSVILDTRWWVDWAS